MLKDLRTLLELKKVHNIVILSPHPDDVALSIGGSVCCFPQNSKQTLLTVFSRSSYAPGYPDISGEAEITRLRHQEEQGYADRIGAQLLCLDFPDTSILGYTESEMKGDYQTNDRFAEVGVRIDKELSLISPTLIFCPLAIGEHIDHRIVFEAVAQSQYAKNQTYILYYEDLPYAWYLTEAELLAQVKIRLGENAQQLLVDMTHVANNKRDNILVYHSQLNPQTIERDEKSIFDYAAQLHNQPHCYAERLWFIAMVNCEW